MISFQNKFCLAAGVPTLTVSRSQPSLLFKKDSRSSDSNRQSFQVWGRHSWRESANEGPFHAATSSKLEPCCLMGALWIRCAERYATEGGRVGGISTPATGVALQDRARKSNKQSIPETAWLATYSSLRRKKIQRQPGESSSLRPSGQWPTLECGAKHFRWLLETRFNRACVFACVLTWLLFKSNSTSQKREEKA